MRTDRKKVEIRDEGVVISDDVEFLDFTGTGINADQSGTGVEVQSPDEADGNNFIIGVNTHKLTVSATEPLSPAVGDLWVDTT